MATLYSIDIATGDYAQPLVSGSQHASLRRLINFLRQVSAGNAQATTTITVRNTGVKASAVVTCASVVDGDTVTLSGVTFTAEKIYADATVTCVVANTDVDDTVTLNFGGDDVVMTAKNAESVEDGEFNISGTNAAAATSLAACLNANSTFAAAAIATAANNVVTVRALTSGTGGNAYTLASSDADGLAVSGANFAGGGSLDAGEFEYQVSNSATGDSLVAAIAANSTTSAIALGSNASGAVTITCKVPGKVGNAITIATSDGTRLAITGSVSRLAGGSEDTSFTFSR